MKGQIILGKGKILLASMMIISLLSFITRAQEASSKVREISGIKEVESVIKGAGENLIAFDVFAKWCNPCKVLSPILEQIAQEYEEKVTIYKIDVDKNQDLAGAFGVKGVPHVVFVKNGKPVHSMTGLRSKDDYIRVINKFFKT